MVPSVVNEDREIYVIVNGADHVACPDGLEPRRRRRDRDTLVGVDAGIDARVGGVIDGKIGVDITSPFVQAPRTHPFGLILSRS